MKHSFYDVKLRKKVTAEVTDFKSYGKGTSKRFAFKGKTKDGRNLTRFISKDEYDKFMGGAKCAGKACAKKACKK